MYLPLDHPYFAEDHPVILDEMQFSDLLHTIDPRDLPYRDYAPLVKYVKYIETKESIMKFFVPSPIRINKWNCYIQFVEWGAQMRDTTLSAPEAARLLFWSGNLRIHCQCPAYLFWGMQYIDTQLDIAIRPETRFPAIRNPQLKGIACKHLIRTLKVLPFHLGDMANAIKQQREHFS